MSRRSIANLIPPALYDEAQAQLDELIDAAMSGETILITKDGDRTVQLVPVREREGRPGFGSGQGLMIMADDFDEPLNDFEPVTSVT